VSDFFEEGISLTWLYSIMVINFGILQQQHIPITHTPFSVQALTLPTITCPGRISHPQETSSLKGKTKVYQLLPNNHLSCLILLPSPAAVRAIYEPVLPITSSILPRIVVLGSYWEGSTPLKLMPPSRMKRMVMTKPHMSTRLSAGCRMVKSAQLR